jgi:WD40 repeat protein
MHIVALADGSLVTAARDGVVALSPSIGAPARKLNKPSKDPRVAAGLALAGSPDGSLIACAVGGLQVWSAKTREKVYKLKSGGSPVFSRDGAALAFVDRTRVFVANASDGSSVREVAEDWARGQMSAALRDLSFSADGTEIAAAGEYGRVRFFGLKEDAVLRTEQAFPLPAGPISAMALSPGGWLACAEAGTRIYLRSPSGKERLLDATQWLGTEWPPDPGDSAQSTSIGFSPDDTLVLAAFDARGRLPGKASWASLWDVESGEAIAHLVFENAVARYVAFGPDGKEALVACCASAHLPPADEDGVWAWEIATAKGA